MSLSRKIGNIGSILDSASTGTFMSKAASDAAFESISYSSLSGTPTVLDSANVTAIIDSAYVQARQTLGSVVLDSAAIISVIDSNYVQARTTTVSSGFVDYEYTATSGQTTFQDSDLNSNILSYTTDGIMVFYNGVLLRDSSDYTASDGSSVVLASGADSGSTVSISKWTIPSAGGGAGGASFTWGGDRGIAAGGNSTAVPSIENVLDYYDITTPGNASDFGDLSSTSSNGIGLSDATKALFNIGYNGSARVNTIDYITVATTSNASDFGDMVSSLSDRGSSSDGTYGLFAGGNGSVTDIDYVTIATPSNATDFGDLLTGSRYPAGVSNGTYGIFAGGYTTNYDNLIQYVTIASPGNASDFGDLTLARRGHGSVSDTTRGVFSGGQTSSVGMDPTIDYITMASPSNASDFGDLTIGKRYFQGSGNETYGTAAGGIESDNTRTANIDYFTIQTTANATTFGDLTVGRYGCAGASGSPS